MREIVHRDQPNAAELKKKATRVRLGANKLILAKGTGTVWFKATKTKTYKIVMGNVRSSRGDLTNASFGKFNTSGRSDYAAIRVRDDSGHYVEPMCGMYSFTVSGRKIPAGSYLNFDSGIGRQTKWMTGKIRLKKGELFSVAIEGSPSTRTTCTIRIS